VRIDSTLLIVALAGIMAGLYLHEILASIVALGLAIALFVKGLDSLNKPGGF